MKTTDPSKRLIVALDVSTADEALRLASRLSPTVSFFKVGWQLFIAGHWRRVVEELPDADFFVDLKLPGDIDNTVAELMRVCIEDLPRVRFLTLSEHVRATAVAAARRARGERDDPELLAVPMYSSLAEEDLVRNREGGGRTLDEYILEKSASMLEAGCDGLIVSGPQIATVRGRFPRATLVSPGIRPSGAAQDDHKRATTPTDAIRMGSDFLVVGRPIRAAADPAAVARSIVDEIASV